jgi:hypothetical protein
MKTLSKIILSIIFLLPAVSIYSQWQPDVRLTNDPAQSFAGEDRCIASNGNYVFVVWQDHRDGDAEVYFKRSTDRGDTWSTDTRLSATPDFSGAPSIAVYQSIVHVFWQDLKSGTLDIYYRRSTDNGLSWEAEVRLTTDPQYSYYPSVSVSGANVYLAWEDNRAANYEIYFKRSTNSGLNWSSDMRLTVDAAASNYVSVSSSGQNVHCAWQDARSGATEIYYKNSTDGGVTWSPDARLTNDPASSVTPSVTVTGQNVYVFWSDQRDGNIEVYFKKSTNGGTAWGSDTRLTNATGNSINPAAIAFGPLVAFVWPDMRTGYYKVYYKVSSDAGLNWSNDILLSQPSNTGSAVNASIDASDSAAHVIWNDSKDGNLEIYYKRNIFSSLVGTTNQATENPSGFSLSQNYPNPFNPNTKIDFGLPESGKIRIAIYDVLGREKLVVTDEYMQAGFYTADIDGSKLASGIYFCRVSFTGAAESYSETLKIMLVK